MFRILLSRLASRETLLAALAQGAVTWGAHHLTSVIAEQQETIGLLEAARDGYAADCERLAAERDEARRQADELRAAFAYLEIDPAAALVNAAKARHPAGQAPAAPADVTP